MSYATRVEADTIETERITSIEGTTRKFLEQKISVVQSRLSQKLERNIVIFDPHEFVFGSVRHEMISPLQYLQDKTFGSEDEKTRARQSEWETELGKHAIDLMLLMRAIYADGFTGDDTFSAITPLTKYLNEMPELSKQNTIEVLKYGVLAFDQGRFHASVEFDAQPS